MADLYKQLGEQMSSAVEYGSEGTKFWQLDQIQQMYDIKRKRLEKLFNTLGYGVEAATRIGDTHSRNQRLSEYAKSKGYEADFGFLGLGKGKYFKPAELKKTGETDKYEMFDEISPRKEVSPYEVSGFGEEDIFSLLGGGE